MIKDIAEAMRIIDKTKEIGGNVVEICAKYNDACSERRDALEHPSKIWDEYFACRGFLEDCKADLAKVKLMFQPEHDTEEEKILLLNTCQSKVDYLNQKSRELRDKADRIAPMHDVEEFYILQQKYDEALSDFETLSKSHNKMKKWLLNNS